MSASLIILLAVLYLGFLFLLAYRVEKKSKSARNTQWEKWTYALALPVYCTAWTFYGSVGKASTDGWTFLTIYIGPLLAMPLLLILVRKMIMICNVQRISTISDFISSRFDSVTLSVLTTALIVIGIIPYISIQLKAVSQSFDFLISNGDNTVHAQYFLTDNAFYLSIILSLFIIFFVFRTLESDRQHKGLMAAIAVDSIIKLLAFIAVGVFVTFFLFDGFADVFNNASPEKLSLFSDLNSIDGFEWFLMILLSLSAFLLLPRQFHTIVIENTNQRFLSRAAWVFPIYLLLINLFVIPVALGGETLLGVTVDPDFYVLALPILNDQNLLALFTFLGGFSAATVMIIVSTISLSLMMSNNIILPALFKGGKEKLLNSEIAVRSRKVAVIIIMLLAYFYYRYVAELFPLVSIGLISFVAVLQFAPAMLSALYWKDANRHGVKWGLIAGFIVWLYTLVIPTIVEVGVLPISLLTEGPFGLHFLKPQALFGIQMEPVAHGTFWSIIFNLILFFTGTFLREQTPKERNIAEVFADIYKYATKSDEKILWKGELLFKDLVRVTENLLGKEKSHEALNHYKKEFGKPVDDQGQVDSRFVNYTQRLLSGVVGSTSARILISNLSREEEIELSEVVQLLKETSETARLNSQLRIQSLELKRKTQALIKANERLTGLDKEKDDFISTVTHELRSPLTAIKAFVEILQDHETSPEEQENFLETINNEIDRMSRLIDQVLDLEKLEAGVITIAQQPIHMMELLQESLKSMRPLMHTKGIQLHENYDVDKDNFIIGDEDRLKQALINLFSNAVKYSREEEAVIDVALKGYETHLEVTIRDNGKGIKKENLDRIFDKFFQARDQTRKKPKGTGLGLPITKRIVELHGGTIHVVSEWRKGTVFNLRFPVNQNELTNKINEEVSE